MYKQMCVFVCMCGMNLAVSAIACEVWDLLRIKFQCEFHTALHRVLMNCHVFLNIFL
jgi:hypothetical protein